MKTSSGIVTMRNISLIAALSFLTLGSFQSAESAKPNLVYIMVDDMGPADAGFMGSEVIATPNLDRLASESLLLKEAY
jgi:hypothetical protein